LSCNIAGLTSNVSEDVVTQITKKLPSSTTPLSFDALAQGNPREYPETMSLDYIFVADSMGLSSFV